eukprot:1099828_1
MVNQEINLYKTLWASDVLCSRNSLDGKSFTFGSPPLHFRNCRLTGVVVHSISSADSSGMWVVLDDSTGVFPTLFPQTLIDSRSAPTVGDLLGVIGKVSETEDRKRYLAVTGFEIKDDCMSEVTWYLQVLDAYKHHYFKQSETSEKIVSTTAQNEIRPPPASDKPIVQSSESRIPSDHVPSPLKRPNFTDYNENDGNLPVKRRKTDSNISPDALLEYLTDHGPSTLSGLASIGGNCNGQNEKVLLAIEEMMINDRIVTFQDVMDEAQKAGLNA